MGLTLHTAPVAEPISTAEAKSHARVDISADDTLIDDYIAAARRWAELYTRRQFVTATWDLTLDAFPLSDRCPIWVPLPPLQSVTSISYVDADGQTQTWDAAEYLVDSKSEPGRILPAYGETWPVTRDQANAVTVRFVAGYGLAAAVPATLKTAVRLLVSHLYETREPIITGTIVAKVPLGVEAVLHAYRVYMPAGAA